MFAFSIFMLKDSNFKFGGGQSRINNILLKKKLKIGKITFLHVNDRSKQIQK